MFKVVKPYVLTACIIIIVFVAVSLLDIIISVLYARFYTPLAFIVTFGAGGVFAAVWGFQYGIDASATKNELTKWGLILFLMFSGLLFFFLLSRLEGSAYEAPFKGFGITLASGSLLFIKEKV